MSNIIRGYIDSIIKKREEHHEDVKRSNERMKFMRELEVEMERKQELCRKRAKAEGRKTLTKQEAKCIDNAEDWMINQERKKYGKSVLDRYGKFERKS